MNRRIFCVFVGAALTALASVSYAMKDASMVLYLPFEDGSGTVAKDLSGSGNDGKVLGAAAWTTGKIGKALEFNGKDTVVEIASNATLQMGESPFTIEAWIKGSPDSASWARIVDKFYGTGYVVGRRGGDLVVGGEFSGSPNSFATNTPVLDDAWHHIALTREVVTAGALKVNVFVLYLDGKEENNGSGGAISQKNADTTPVRIGAGDECCEEGGPAAYWFKGVIDEVAIYKKALTAAQVAADMNGVLPATAVEPNGKLATFWGAAKDIAR